MGFISWIVVGIIAGALAKLIMPGKQGGGILMTMVLGILGGLLGGFLGSTLFHTGLNGFSFQSIIVATLGALLVSFIWGFIQRSRA